MLLEQNFTSKFITILAIKFHTATPQNDLTNYNKREFEIKL